MNITKKEIAEGYDKIAKNVHLDTDFYRRCIAMHKGYSGSIVDIGCGQGLLLKELRKVANQDATFSGTDISAEMCRITKENNPDAIIKQGDAEDLPFDDNQFDIVFMTEVLEHLLDYPKALSEVKRVLKTDGVFIVTVPNRDWLRYDFYDKIRNKSFQPVDDHYFRFKEIADLLESGGFKIEKHRGSDNLFYYGWKHKLEQFAAFFLPFLHKRMKRLIFRCVNTEI